MLYWYFFAYSGTLVFCWNVFSPCSVFHIFPQKSAVYFNSEIPWCAVVSVLQDFSLCLCSETFMHYEWSFLSIENTESTGWEDCTAELRYRWRINSAPIRRRARWCGCDLRWSWSCHIIMSWYYWPSLPVTSRLINISGISCNTFFPLSTISLVVSSTWWLFRLGLDILINIIMVNCLELLSSSMQYYSIRVFHPVYQLLFPWHSLVDGSL